MDNVGNAYVTGSTDSRNFPTTPDAYQPNHRSWHLGSRNGFVSKLNTTGGALLYSTYLGGSGGDVAQGIAIDSSGSAYVIGIAESSDFPTTPGSVQPNPGDDRFCWSRLCTDAFVTKLNPSGTALMYSTYLGGNLFDEGNGIALDAGGNVYVTGETNSVTFPIVDAFQPNPAGGRDGFVAKLNANGSALIYSSYLGGGSVNGDPLEGEDAGLRIAVDVAWNAYVIGVTRSSNFPTVNTQQPTFGGGFCVSVNTCRDAFVTKIAP